MEPQQNISLTRNKAIANATGDFIAFIDDDEFPAKRWLLTLFEASGKYGADGVLGPVKCHFDEKPPRWVIKGKFYERPTYPTGFVIDWTKGRTGNVLLRRQILEDGGSAFSQSSTGQATRFLPKNRFQKDTYSSGVMKLLRTRSFPSTLDSHFHVKESVAPRDNWDATSDVSRAQNRQGGHCCASLYNCPPIFPSVGPPQIHEPPDKTLRPLSKSPDVCWYKTS